MKQEKMTKKTPILGLWLLVALAMINLNCGGNKFASEDLIGTWKSTDTKYTDTFFKIEKNAITFHTKEGDSNVYSIMKVKKEHMLDPQWIQVTIFYAENDRQKGEFPFYLQSTGKGIIRFKNQPSLIWKNTKSRTDDSSEKNAESFLFVCSQNSCLSPMAEGLAKRFLGKDVRIESAGLKPIMKGAAHEAIWVLMDMHNIDISLHETRSVSDIQIDSFERIIVLEAFVLEALETRYPSITDRFTLWDIEDPCGNGKQAFWRAAEIIEKMIERDLAPSYSK